MQIYCQERGINSWIKREFNKLTILTNCAASIVPGGVIDSLVLTTATTCIAGLNLSLGACDLLRI